MLSHTFYEPVLAQANTKKAQSTGANKKTSSQSATHLDNSQEGNIWMYSSLGLLLVIVGLVVYGKLEIDKLNKKVKFEEFKSKELQKKLKLAVGTITKMEANPDLLHSREFNLDYLRMRMDEGQFHSAIANQIQVKIKQIVSVALRPTQAETGTVGIAATSGRQIEETFDVTYETGEGAKLTKRVLFRIQIKLTKLPTQPTSVTINELIECMTTFLSPAEDHDNWQPTIQGRMVRMDWDQKAKPTPLLVLEQLGEGSNVTIRTKRAGVK